MSASACCPPAANPLPVRSPAVRMAHRPVARPSGRLSGLVAALRTGLGLTFGLNALRNLSRQRQQLMDLDAAALHDLGLDREAALREASRPFWDVPHHWRG